MDNASDHEDRIARSGMSSRFRRLNASGGVEIRLGCRSTVFVYRFYAHACGASRVLVGLRSKTSLGYTMYLGIPYYGRWIWSATKMLVDKNHISLAELMDKVVEVKSRYETK